MTAAGKEVVKYDAGFAAAQLGAADLVADAYLQGLTDATDWHAAVALRMQEHREAVAERAALRRRRTVARVKLFAAAAVWGWILAGGDAR